MTTTDPVTMEKLIALAKRRGFIYQGSEIYGGLAGTYDYGPLGTALKNNIKNLWWKMFVDGRDDMYGMDAAILMNGRVWETTGHVAGFADPLVECTKCKKRFRADQLVEDKRDLLSVQKEFSNAVEKFMEEEVKPKIKETSQQVGALIHFVEFLGKDLKKEEIEAFRTLVAGKLKAIESDRVVTKTSLDLVHEQIGQLKESQRYLGFVMATYLRRHVKCPNCQSMEWSVPRPFNMMLQTRVGAMEDSSSISYLRPETAQGMFVNFKNVVDSFHPKMPFGMGQIGKAFRNEITPRDFIFRLRELEQMEIEYFVRPEDWERAFEEWRVAMGEWITAVGIDRARVHEMEIAKDELAHYSKRTIDFEFEYPFGQKELYGLAYRTDFDLGSHAKASSVDLSYIEEDGTRFVPHVIEPSFGVDRTVLAVMLSAYAEDELGGGGRTYLKFHPRVAPVKAAVFPLMKNKPELVAKAREIYLALKKEIPQVMWDDNGNVGKRYRRQDEIGTPFCITVDFDTLGEDQALKDTVTLRDRDTGEQKRMSTEDLISELKRAII